MSSPENHFTYVGDRQRHVAFPLGGIGTGSISLTGSGRLTDWSIRNRPAIHQTNGYSHFAVKAESGGQLRGARVLHGPYEGLPTGSPSYRPFDGFGFGANRDTLAGVPHFENVVFTGKFPSAELAFHDPAFPGVVQMTAFSPFIPHNDRDSSMPVAMFEFAIRNTTGDTMDYTVAATLGNYGCDSGVHTFSQSGGLSTLHLTSAEATEAERRGDLALVTDCTEVEHVDYHFRGQWFDSLARHWAEFARPGRLVERRYTEPRAINNMWQQPEHGTLAARIQVPKGEIGAVRFAIAWNYPDGSIYWFNRRGPGSPHFPGKAPTWKNYYATQWRDSAASGADAFRRWDALRQPTFEFRDALFDSALPVEIVDAVQGTLGILRSATILRLENGDLWGWEGQHPTEGSCEGSCTHVWNYQQTLPYLFPALERSLRQTEFTYNQLSNGGLTFRQRLPLGSGFDIIGPCADGHFGAVIKFYRDWKMCGDHDWLLEFWPKIKRAVQYAWSPENPDRWDPDATGVLQGRQHHTLDMELFGPNSWLSSMYLCALRAAEAMASQVGDEPFAKQCAAIASNGIRYVDERLFNGRHYLQEIDLGDRSVLEKFATGRQAGVLSESVLDAYWSDEYRQICYQIGQGCLTDQLLGQWHADLAGLGRRLFDDRQVGQALRTTFEQNFRSSLKDHFNPCRVYAYEREGGLLNCTWPQAGTKPALPVPYAEEVWTGLEYTFASFLIGRGLVDEGLTIVRAARARHDGSNRNPWNDIECGSYYARALSSYALLVSYTGFRYDGRDGGTFTFSPVDRGRGRWFWSAGRGWGTVEQTKSSTATIHVSGGELSVNRLNFAGWGRVKTADGEPCVVEDDVSRLVQPRRLRAGEKLVLGLEGYGDA